MLVRWLNVSLAMLVMFAGLELSDQFGFLALSASFVLMLVVGVLVPIGIEHLVRGLRRLQPQLCSIYNPYFWWHERYWKLSGRRADTQASSTGRRSSRWSGVCSACGSAPGSSTTAAASSSGPW